MPERIFGPAQDSEVFRAKRTMLHATSVRTDGGAALIVGASGSGKSSLALQLMALGATLVSDDQTRLEVEDGVLVARAPETLRGRIEARGVGILAVPHANSAIVTLVIDMDTVETDRLPPARHCRILGQRLPLLHKLETGYFPAAILHYLEGGRSA